MTQNIAKRLFDLTGANINVMGDLYMNDKSRTIGDISGRFGDNVNIQGDNVNQIKSVNDSQLNTAYQDLYNDINKIQDEEKKEQAEFFAHQLQEAGESDDKSKIKKMLGFLKGSLGTAASLVTIAKFFGVTL
ncbi:hypothetical protein [Priestia megaterium]|uniref:hypothetical protein n=1 Tax=Priestia megaterium TaxID=1404 RepID=UPI001FB28F93|nr:hypothetical protein [Priestia megaterium]